MLALVDVYPYRLKDDVPEFLILKRATDRQYGDQWRMVGGKVEDCEAAWQSGLRELREETGFFPKLYWAVPSINQFYEAEKDVIHHIPVFAAEISGDHSIVLNEEHTDYKWIDSSRAAEIIQWPEQYRLIKLINNILTKKYILNEWKIAL
jgi:dATP pyrophosphohydrolase